MFWEIVLTTGIIISAAWLMASVIGILLVLKEIDSDPNETE